MNDRMNPDDSLDPDKTQRAVDALLKILNANRLERVTYLVIAASSFVALVIFAGWGVYKNSISIQAVIVLFGPTGAMAYCVARILDVWKDSIKLLTSILQRTLQ